MRYFEVDVVPLQQLVIRDDAGNEVVAGTFRDGEPEPFQIRFFGIEPESLEADADAGGGTAAAELIAALARPDSIVAATAFKTATGESLGEIRARQLSLRLYTLYFATRHQHLVGAEPARVAAPPVPRARRAARATLFAEAADEERYNGCTLAPDEVPWLMDWVGCCADHDICYGGDDGAATSRRRCDDRLFDCLKHRAGWFVAYSYWAAVRAAGAAYYRGEGDPS